MGGRLSKLRRKWTERRAEHNGLPPNTLRLPRAEHSGLPPNTLRPPRPDNFTAESYNIDQSAFCQRCNEREYPLCVLDVIEGRRESLWLSRLAFEPEMNTSLSCSLCKMLECARRDLKKHPIIEAVFFYLSTESGLYPTTDGRLRILRISRDLRISCRESPLSASTFQEVIDRSHIDLSVFQKHIHTCQATHEKCNSHNKSERVTGLRVIDCQSRDVISASADCKYAALSYVWGSQATDDIRNLPRTISDAISATLGLGLQFLWVDRYCINQKSQTDKHVQIQQMGLIYGQAEVTLIAAAGKDPTYGLPGISARNLNRDHITRISRFEFNMMHQTPQELLSRTVWQTRGWTYQEFVLSRRTLIFTDQFAFLECHKTLVEEWPASAWKLGFCLSLSHHYWDARDDPISLNIGVINTHPYTGIRRYTMRKLTYPSDALNGILGILARFEHASTPIYHLWGLPYALDQEELYLPLGWWCSIDNYGYASCAKALITRRKNLPSWSWTGWEGVPSFSDLHVSHKEGFSHTGRRFAYTGSAHELTEEFPMVIEAYLENSKQALTLEGLAALTKETPFGARRSVSRCLHVEGWTHPLKIIKEYNSPESDSSSPRIQLGWEGITMSNAAFTAGDIQKGAVDIRNLRALFITKATFLVLGDTPVGTERLGIARTSRARSQSSLRKEHIRLY